MIFRNIWTGGHRLCVGGGEGDVFALGVLSMQQVILWPHSPVVPGSISCFWLRKKQVWKAFYQNRLTDMSTVRSWVTSLKSTRLRIFTEAYIEFVNNLSATCVQQNRQNDKRSNTL